MKPLQIK